MSSISRIHDPMRIARRRLLLGCGSLPLLATIGCASGASRPEGPQALPLSSPQRPYEGETPGLRARLRGTLVGAYGRAGAVTVVAVDLATGQRRETPAPAGAYPRPHDDSGRIIRALHQPPVIQWQAAAAPARTLWRAPQGVESLEPVRLLSVSPDGARVAWVVAPQGQRSWQVGRLLVLDIEAAAGQGEGASARDLGGEILATSLVRDALAWFPDSRHLAVAARGPLGRQQPAPTVSRAEPDPQIEIVDVVQGTRRVLGPGREVWVPPDGGPLLVRRHALDARHPDPKAAHDAWAYPPRDLWLMDVESGAAHPLPRVPPEITGVIAWLDQRHLVYRGHVTPGAPSGLTTGNSPLVGPKRLQAIKVMDVQTGEFLTVLDGVDPRSTLWVRYGR